MLLHIKSSRLLLFLVSDVFFLSFDREQMRFISCKGNICIPDKSMIKESTGHHLLTIQHTAIWPGGVYSGRHIHTHTWYNPEFGAGSFHRQTGWAGYHLCPFSPNHKEEKPEGKKTHFHHNRWMYSHILLQSHQNNATTIQAQHLFQSESKPLPETCSKTKWHKSNGVKEK